MEDMFNLFQANFEKLAQYGFRQSGELFHYSRDIVDGQFTLFVTVNKAGSVTTKVVDTALNEEYVLHLVGGVGEFVGKVKQAIEDVLTDIRDRCFEKVIHKSVQAKAIKKYIIDRYDTMEEYLWSKYPTDAIWRRKDNKKWFALIMTISKSKLGFKSDEPVEVMDVRAEPKEIERLVDNKIFFRGYHMNKSHWLTFILNDTIKTDRLFELIDRSCLLAK